MVLHSSIVTAMVNLITHPDDPLSPSPKKNCAYAPASSTSDI